MHRRHSNLLMAALGIAVASTVYAENIPRLGAIYYGQLRTPFGYPATAGDGVTLLGMQTDGGKVSQFDIGPLLGPGVNYRLEVDVVDSGSGIEGSSVADGESIYLEALSGGVTVPLIGDTNALVDSGAVDRRDL